MRGKNDQKLALAHVSKLRLKYLAISGRAPFQIFYSRQLYSLASLLRFALRADNIVFVAIVVVVEKIRVDKCLCIIFVC
jgi:hypothetical protein